MSKNVTVKLIKKMHTFTLKLASGIGVFEPESFQYWLLNEQVWMLF
ncbi:hypothetical protein GPLA_4664 [Paraglaciecola polaris LMG 21857]|uniref:Uncharacterized protein n=1 Tax=Paraglaciecola polaris LMG 21857 TaxID=1129793 RepID=K7A3S0_9ALTE|nr:hypothetical protein GPLA_4664 [Paraglaciecola polaris LMG 21857]